MFGDGCPRRFFFRDHVRQSARKPAVGLRHVFGRQDGRGAAREHQARFGELANQIRRAEGDNSDRFVVRRRHPADEIRLHFRQRDGSFARRAFDEHERTIELDPSRKDADLVLGTYRYIVANLSRVMRWAAYIIGFGGGRERAIQQLESCAAYRSDVQVEAKFALVLIYSRERRHDEVRRLLQSLREEFPTNRLLWLESGANELRAGRLREALALLTTGIGMFERDSRPKSFGEGALWYFKRGAALVANNDGPRAEADLRRALELEARDWVRGRVHCELGKLADLNGDRPRARQEYQQARFLAGRDNDPQGVAEAERLIDRPYKPAGAKGTNPRPARQ